MLAGIYYGAQYGGSTTAILINVPGESSSVVTAIDGYQMARQGRAGAALAAAGLGSFFAGCVGTHRHRRVRAAADRARVQVRPGRVLLADGARPDRRRRAGVRLAAQGDRDDHPRPAARRRSTPTSTPAPRATASTSRSSPTASASSSIAMGVFGFGEIITNLGQPASNREVFTKDVKGLWPTKRGLQARPGRRCCAARRSARSSASCPAAARCCRRSPPTRSRRRSPATSGRFGKGDIHGVAGPESANNAGAQTSFIPMLTLGIPPNAVMALMVGAMTINSIQPGPQVMTSNPQLFWGLIASMWVGNLMLVDPEPAADRHLDQAADGALPLPVPGDPAVLLHRRLLAQQQQLRRLHDGDLRRARLPLLQAELRAGAAAARLHPRADDGGEPAPRAAAVARRLDHLRHAAALGRRC